MKPSTQRVLRLLRDRGSTGATTADLVQPDVGGARFGGRIHELRGSGFDIEARRVGNNQSRYWLRSDNDAGLGSGSPAREASSGAAVESLSVPSAADPGAEAGGIPATSGPARTLFDAGDGRQSAALHDYEEAA